MFIFSSFQKNKFFCIFSTIIIKKSYHSDGSILIVDVSKFTIPVTFSHFIIKLLTFSQQLLNKA